jgi:hypothetical protein
MVDVTHSRASAPARRLAPVRVTAIGERMSSWDAPPVPVRCASAQTPLICAC